MNFKTLVAPALLASTAFFGPGALEAEASTRYCYNTNVGDRICIESVRQAGPNHKDVIYTVNGYAVNERVFCNPNHANDYFENVYGIACFEFS